MAVSPALLGDLVEVLLRPYRAIQPTGGTPDLSPVIADAVVDEHPDDELMVTDHPVEQGAVITDHAYKKPVSLGLTYAWQAGSFLAYGDPTLRAIYARLLKIQADRALCSVFTGKRLYRNMLIMRVNAPTTRETENAIVVKIAMRELILVSTSVISVSSAADLASPEKHASVVPQGNVALVPGFGVEPAAP